MASFEGCCSVADAEDAFRLYAGRSLTSVTRSLFLACSECADATEVARLFTSGAESLSSSRLLVSVGEVGAECWRANEDGGREPMLLFLDNCD